MTVGRRRELLPFRISLGHDEALDGFLERLAVANGVRSAEIIRRIKTTSGPSAPTTAFMMFKPDPRLIERLHRLSGVDTASLSKATLARFDGGFPLFLEGFDTSTRYTFRQVVTQGWFPQFGSQVCTECLAQDGIWRLEWRLPIVATCIRHGIFLTALCAGCGQRFRTHRYAVLRPILDASQPCGNSLGLRTRCCHSVPAHPRLPADPGVLVTARQIEHALRTAPTVMLGEPTDPRLYLAELRHLATLLLHMLSRPGGVAYVDWADDLHREAITRTTELRGPRWGISPPSSAEIRGRILAEAHVILNQDGLDAAADRLAPWLALIDDIPNGPTGWLRNRTKRTPTMGRLIDASLAHRHHVGRRLGNRATLCPLSPEAIPQLVDVEIYLDLFDCMLGSYEWIGRMYVSLCLARAATNAATWAEAAAAIGLDPAIGMKTARAASRRRRASPDLFTGAVRATELVMPRDRDFREREVRVRALADPSSTAREEWCASTLPHRKRIAWSYALTWMWCEVAQAPLDTSPAWPAAPGSPVKAAYRAFAARLSPSARDELRKLALR
ncbi:TniQ family protein [Mycobacterium avium]|uniref:TniQ family protein n=1 Tax=Mycobacterium avium TaxID=1764 RepID=UPI001CC70008|nr:TniQ family protein [Mycobacterium avium]MBZ4521881.1 TniQ family protein [Mycobacterium avium subsp. hominissuis]MBZ4531264.1 TniQ family protein [Mycobacterium avium subsp. hominissuis]